jgi:hypothetical protein
LILVDSQKEVIHRIANLFSQGKCPLHQIHPSLLALYAVMIEWLSLSSKIVSFFQSPTLPHRPMGINRQGFSNPTKNPMTSPLVDQPCC